MIKNIHVQSCLNCRPKPICDCGNQGIGFEIKDCKRINLLVGNHGVGKSWALAHVNLEGKPFVKVLGASLLPPIETIYIEDPKNFELGIADNLSIGGIHYNSKYLVLDEIGNNTHYSAHKPFWKNLIKQIIEHDLQVFATTHSYEMIEALVEAAKEHDFIGKDEVRLFKIIKNAKEKIKVFDYNLKMLQYAIKQKIEIR